MIEVDLAMTSVAGVPGAEGIEGQVVFYEGNNATQNIVHSTTDEAGQDFRPAQNDEARSVKLIFCRPGTYIEVYDSPDADRRDDYAIILVKQLVGEIIVGTFEQSRDDANVTVVYVRNNGLDGKVSRVKIS